MNLRDTYWQEMFFLPSFEYIMIDPKKPQEWNGLQMVYGSLEGWNAKVWISGN
jgi:hypothetical protein